MFNRKCYFCGDKIGKEFYLVSLGKVNVDRGFVVCKECKELLTKEDTIVKVKIIKDKC